MTGGRSLHKAMIITPSEGIWQHSCEHHVKQSRPQYTSLQAAVALLLSKIQAAYTCETHPMNLLWQPNFVIIFLRLLWLIVSELVRSTYFQMAALLLAFLSRSRVSQLQISHWLSLWALPLKTLEYLVLKCNWEGTTGRSNVGCHMHAFLLYRSMRNRGILQLLVDHF